MTGEAILNSQPPKTKIDYQVAKEGLLGVDWMDATHTIDDRNEQLQVEIIRHIKKATNVVKNREINLERRKRKQIQLQRWIDRAMNDKKEISAEQMCNVNKWKWKCTWMKCTEKIT